MHWAAATKNTKILCYVLVTGTKEHLSFGKDIDVERKLRHLITDVRSW